MISAPGKERLLPIGSLRPNRWNPNVMDEGMFAKELASIRKFGFVDPVTVRWVDDGYEIIDGENRWRAAEKLEMTEIPCWDLGVVPDHVAMQITLVLNEVRGQAEPRKLADLLRDLVSRESKDSLLATLPYSKEAFEQITGIGRMDLGNVFPSSPTHRLSSWVERIYRMPLDAAEVIDRAIAQHKEERGEMPDWQALVNLCEASE